MPHDPSLALATDQYELTMGQAYWKNGMAEHKAEFHMFFRTLPFGGGYAVWAGLETLLGYLERFRFSTEDMDYLAGLRDNRGEPLFDPQYLRFLDEMEWALNVDALPEGTVVFPNEPLARVRGPIIQAQLIETLLLNTLNFQTLIATKAARVCWAAQGDPVIEFGFRRAQGLDGALSASRASYIGGCAGTSNTLAGKRFGIPVRGTHAHSWVMSFSGEEESFRAFAQAMPNNCVFLVDTYHTLEGVNRAIVVAQEMRQQGHEMVGVRLDSGDLAWLSIETRKRLNAAGFENAVVMASNELDEYLIRSLKSQGAAIGAWGVGTKLVTAENSPALGGVYKLAAIRPPGGTWLPKLKLSEQTAKISIPGAQEVYRFFNADGRFMADAIVEEGEDPKQVEKIVDPNDPLRAKSLKGHRQAEPLLAPVLVQGRVCRPHPPLDSVRDRVTTQLAGLDPSHLRFENPHLYPVGLSPRLHARREDMIRAERARMHPHPPDSP